MFRRFRAARLLWPTLFAMAGMALLLALGQWQLDRKAWKEELIARLESGAKAEPVPLGRVLPAPDLKPLEFRRVRLSGRFWHGREFHIWTPDPGGPVWTIVTPFELAEGIGSPQRNPMRIVLVVRGAVADEKKAPAARAGGQIDGQVEIVGRIRLDQHSPFVAPPKPGENVWLSRDMREMAPRAARAIAEGAASGGADEALSMVAPVFVEAEDRMGGPEAPAPRLGAVVLANRHLEYALTWFGLAAALAAVFGAFARGRLRGNSN